MITNIDIDEELVAEAIRISGARSKREVVDRALREMVARAARPRFRDFAGVGDIDPAYDPKAPEVRDVADVGRYQVEEGRPAYKVTVKTAAKKAATTKAAMSKPDAKKPARKR
jgi:hypothetical protein